jgi:hypothetical protein
VTRLARRAVATAMAVAMLALAGILAVGELHRPWVGPVLIACILAALLVVRLRQLVGPDAEGLTCDRTWLTPFGTARDGVAEPAHPSVLPLRAFQPGPHHAQEDS